MCRMIEEYLKQLETYDIYSDIKSQSLPLYIWGGGELASEIEELLHEKKIEINGFFIDDEYKNEDRYIEEVVTYSELVSSCDAFNVIVGHSSYEMYADMNNRKNVNKVFLLPFINYHKWERTNVSEFKDRIKELEDIYLELEDEKSKINLLAMLGVHVSGNPHYVLDVFDYSKNFFHNDIFSISERENFVDVGAYDGDTLRVFLKECSRKFNKIYCIEPDKTNLQKLKEYVSSNKLDVVVIETGLWDSKRKLALDDGNNQISSIDINGDESSTTVISVEQLDNIIPIEERISLIKINYLVGVEEALRGSKRILKEYKPKLAITCGFNCTSIIGIYNAIKQSNPDYNIFLRYNHAMVSTLTMYGI